MIRPTITYQAGRETEAAVLNLEIDELKQAIALRQATEGTKVNMGDLFSKLQNAVTKRNQLLCT